jgi:hypothetical protein
MLRELRNSMLGQHRKEKASKKCPGGNQKVKKKVAEGF